MLPEDEYENGHILVSKSLKKLNDAGVKINMGAHGQIQGIGAHWEIWMMQQGGMTNLEALKTATINAADLLGWSDKIGAVEPGKWGDIIAVDGDPLQDVTTLERVKFVMKGGEVVKDQR